MSFHNAIYRSQAWRTAIVAVHAVSFSAYAIQLGSMGRSFPTDVLLLCSLTVLPAIWYLIGLRWRRLVLGGVSGIGLLFWTIVPMAQHAIDRTDAFWVIWVYFEVLLAAVITACVVRFDKPPRASEHESV